MDRKKEARGGGLTKILLYLLSFAIIMILLPVLMWVMDTVFSIVM